MVYMGGPRKTVHAQGGQAGYAVQGEYRDFQRWDRQGLCCRYARAVPIKLKDECPPPPRFGKDPPPGRLLLEQSRQRSRKVSKSTW
jgi:hypothetical protein